MSAHRAIRQFLPLMCLASLAMGCSHAPRAEETANLDDLTATEQIDVTDNLPAPRLSTNPSSPLRFVRAKRGAVRFVALRF